MFKILGCVVGEVCPIIQESKRSVQDNVGFIDTTEKSNMALKWRILSDQEEEEEEEEEKEKLPPLSYISRTLPN